MSAGKNGGDSPTVPMPIVVVFFVAIVAIVIFFGMNVLREKPVVLEPIDTSKLARDKPSDPQLQAIQKAKEGMLGGNRRSTPDGAASRN